nr:hypothetical protein [uncultured Halomonas sp.]
MNVHSTVSKFIFASLATFALSSVAMAESEETNALGMSEEETTGLSGDNQEIRNGRSDQEGMAGKNSANHEALNKGMDHSDMSSDQSMSMEQDNMQDMEDDAPISTTDQEGMVKKDTTNHEEEIDEGM